MLKIKETTILVEEKATDLIKHTKKLIGRFIGMGIGDSIALDDEEAIIFNDCLKVMDEAYDYAELQAKQLDQINQRLDDLMKIVVELKEQQ